MRLFLALAVAGEVKARLAAALAPLSERADEVRWTRPESWHVTLAFLGTVDDQRVSDVVAATRRGTAQAATGPIRLELGAAGHFGRRVLWLGVVDRPDGSAARLGGALQDQLVAADLPCDPKPVRPHLTLARPRGQRRLPRELPGEVPAVTAAWEVGEVTLYRSLLGRGGARHEALAAAPLPPASQV